VRRLLVLSAVAQVVHETLTVPTSVDGASLHVEVARPAGDAKVPIILTYSPYSAIRVTTALSGTNLADDALGREYVPKGYARAVADLLGTRNSSGCWDYGGANEQQSGVDLVNALAKLSWSNGRIAMIGGSYDGTTANMVAARGPEVPALKAIVPEAAINHWYGYAYQDGVRYFLNTHEPADEGFDTPLAFDYGLARTPPDQPTDPAFAQALTGRYQPCDSVEHTQRGYSRRPDYDAFWLARDYRKDATRFRAAALVAHGWQDYNVKQSEGLDLYESLPVDDPQTEAVEGVPFKRLYMFQGSHQDPTGDYAPLVEAFFEHTLKGVDNGVERGDPVVTQGRTAQDVDGQPFRPEAAWPPPTTGAVSYELGRDGEGGTLATRADGQPGSFTDHGLATEELALADPRSEGGWLWFQSPPLERDMRIAGSALLHAVLTASADHGQLDATLADVPPEGDPVPIARGFLNLVYREGLAEAKPVPVGQPVSATVRLAPQDWTVEAGHRLGLYVAGSNTAWALPDEPGFQITLHPRTNLSLPVVGAAPARIVPRSRRAPVTRAAAVRVTPRAGSRRTTFRVRVRVLERHPDTDPRGDAYRVVVRGPGGAGCRARLRMVRSYVPRRGASSLTATLRAPRAGWCRGRFGGVVELRDRHRSGRTSVRRAGRFSFRVR
jgi:X-Pro dipeptidyl-peptidase